MYGGSLENRAKILFEIIDGIRQDCGDDFILGVRLSPERFGMDLNEVLVICKQLIADGKIDLLDISLWDVFKYPEEDHQQEKKLLAYFTELSRENILLTVAGNIRTGKDVIKVLNAGVDIVSIGKAGILHHNFPALVMDNSNFESQKTPVSKEYLLNEGLSDKFITYMRRWPDFVEEP